MFTLHFDDIVPSVEMYDGTVRSTASTSTAGVGGMDTFFSCFSAHEHSASAATTIIGILFISLCLKFSNASASVSYR